MGTVLLRGRPESRRQIAGYRPPNAIEVGYCIVTDTIDSLTHKGLDLRQQNVSRRRKQTVNILQR